MENRLGLHVRGLQPGSHDRRNRGDRRVCNLRGTLAVDNHETVCRIVNVSEGGLGITCDSVIKLKINSTVLISAPEIGEQACLVRWASPPTYGVQFNDAPHRSPLVLAFYDTLPPA